MILVYQKSAFLSASASSFGLVLSRMKHCCFSVNDTSIDWVFIIVCHNFTVVLSDLDARLAKRLWWKIHWLRQSSYCINSWNKLGTLCRIRTCMPWLFCTNSLWCFLTKSCIIVILKATGYVMCFAFRVSHLTCKISIWGSWILT